MARGVKNEAPPAARSEIDPMSIRKTRAGSVVVLSLDNPPVNGLGAALRRARFDEVEDAESDTTLQAIVITGAGKTFSGGADIREFNTPEADRPPQLAELIARLEACRK